MKLGLAFSGGSLKGAAHIGVLEVLHEAGIRPDMVAGSSAGSVIAAMYAHGLTPGMLLKIAKTFPGRQLIDWTRTSRDAFRFMGMLPLFYLGWAKDWSKWLPIGFIRGRKFEQYLAQLLALTPTLPALPLFVTAVDLYSGESIIYTDHPELLAQQTETRYEAAGRVVLPFSNKPASIRSSCSMPGFFNPRELDGRMLIDGAVRQYIPVDILADAGCDKIIAIDLLETELARPGVYNTFLDVYMRSIDIMMADIVTLQLKDDNVFTLSPLLTAMSISSFDQLDYAIEVGRETARKALPALKDYIKKPTS